VEKFLSASQSSPAWMRSSTGPIKAHSCAWASSAGSMSTTRSHSGAYTTSDWPGSDAPRKPRSGLSRFWLAASLLPSSTRTR